MTMRAWFIMVAGLALAGCNSPQSAQGPAAPAVSAASTNSGVTAPGFKLPAGEGCAGDIARYRAVMDNDKATGHVGEGVYNQIIGEIEGASAACQAGRDAEARAMVRSSKARHGYPV